MLLPVYCYRRRDELGGKPPNAKPHATLRTVVAAFVRQTAQAEMLTPKRNNYCEMRRQGGQPFRKQR